MLKHWQEKIVHFTAEENYNRIHFEITNTAPFTNDLAGVYLDDIELYMTCQLEYPCLDIVEFIEPQFPESNVGPNSAFTVENLFNVQSCSLSVRSLSSQGQIVFSNTFSCENGITSPVYWTGTSNSGNSVANGFYSVSVHLANVCGSRAFDGTLVKAADFTGSVAEFECENDKPPKPCCTHEPTIFIDGQDWIMETLLFHSTESIIVASTEPVIVNTGSNVVMRAGERIELNPGFSTDGHELFIAEIVPCDGEEDPPGPSGKLADDEEWEDDDIEEVQPLQAETSPVLYPNPTTGLLTLQHPQTIVQMEAFDTYGRSVARTAPNSTTGTMDLSGNAAGIYIIRATLEDGSTETHRAVLAPQ